MAAYLASSFGQGDSIRAPLYYIGGHTYALAADEIVMDDNAVLGPVDPYIGQSPAASVLTVLERKEPRYVEAQTLISADVARRAINQVYVRTHMPAEIYQSMEFFPQQTRTLPSVE